MQRQDAIALLGYLHLANREVRVTGEAHASIQPALRALEAIAQGLVTAELKPVLPADDPEKSEASLKK